MDDKSYESRIQLILNNHERFGLTREEAIDCINGAEKYDITQWPQFSVASDNVIFTVSYENLEEARNKRVLPLRLLRVLLIERGKWPYAGKWALPGGFLSPGESTLECAIRELREETGLEGVFVKPFKTYSTPQRDVRGLLSKKSESNVISHSHIALISHRQVIASDDASRAQWRYVPIINGALHPWAVNDLAFDHQQILSDAYKELMNLVLYTNSVKELLPAKFTMAEIRQVYEIIFDVDLIPNKRNFELRIEKMGLVKETTTEPRYSQEFSKKPARLFEISDIKEFEEPVIPSNWYK